MSQEAYASTIQSWLDNGETDRAVANYVITRLKAFNATNYSNVGFAGVKFTALRTLEQVALGTDSVALKAFLKEVPVSGVPASATLRYAKRLGLIVASATNLKFKGEVNPAPTTITVTPATGSVLPNVQIGDYLRVRHRFNTTGVRTLIPQGSSINNCGVQIQAQENTIVSLRNGGVLARGNVEWGVASGTQATVLKTKTSPITITTTSTVSGLVQVGDYIELITRTSAPATTQPNMAGFYRVAQVFSAALRLELTPYKRTSEGTFNQQTGAAMPTNIDSIFDWRVLRVRTDVVHLKFVSPVFSAVLADDYVKTTAGDTVRIFKAASTPNPNLLLLQPTLHTASLGGGAPYTAGSTLSALDPTPCKFSVTRAPTNVLSTFSVTRQTGNFTQARVGDYVMLTAQPSTSSAAVFTGKYYRVVNVAGPTLFLDNEKNDPVGQAFVSAGKLYATLTDVASCQVYRSTVTYPFSRIEVPSAVSPQPLLYEVREITSTALSLRQVRYYGYDQQNYELDGLTAMTSTVDYSLLDDHFDVDVVRGSFSENLFLFASGLSVQASTLLAGLVYVKITTPPPNTQFAVHQAVSQPISNFLLLQNRPLEGRFLDGQETVFAPYTPSTLAPILSGPGSRTVSISAVQVLANEYASVVLKALQGTFSSEIRVADRIFINAIPTNPINVPGSALLPALREAASKRYFSVSAVSSDRKSLVLNFSSSEAIKPAMQNESRLSVIDLETVAGLNPLQLSSFSVAADATCSRPAIRTNFIRLEELASSVINADMFVRFALRVNSASTDYIFKVLEPSPTQAVVELSPSQVQVINGVYEVSSGAVYDFPEQRSTLLERVQFQTRTDALADVTAQLAAFTEKLPATLRTAGDQVITRLYSPTTSQGDLVSTLHTVAAQVTDVAPELEVVIRGDFVGETITTTPRSYSVMTQTSVATENAAQQTWFQDIMAIVSVVSYSKTLLNGTGQVAQQEQGKSLTKIKNLYVDASLQVLGYTAQLSNTVPVLSAGAKHRISALLFLAEKMRASARDALSALNRLNVATQADSTINTLINVIQSSIPDSFGTDKRTFFVTGGGVDFSSVLALYPTTLLNGLKSDEARARRQAIQEFIAVAPEASVAVLKRSYTRIRARQRSRAITLADLQNHYAQTTDPQTRQLLERAIALVEARKNADQVQEVTKVAEIEARQLALAEPSPANELDQQTVERAVADVQEDVFPSVSSPTITPFVAASLPAPVAAPPKTGSVPQSTSTPSKSESAPSLLPVTNLFGSDILDFRMISAAVPYAALNAGQFNATNYAYITLCDFDGRNEGRLPHDASSHHLEGLEGLGSTNFRYNQFKLTGLQESHAEKFQLVDTLSDSFMAFAFGTRPEVWSISGVLINDTISDQLNKFRLLYEKYLRITALAENKQKMVVNIPALRIKIYGYAVAFVPQHNPEVQTATPFSLQILITNWATLPLARTGEMAERAAKVSKLLANLQSRASATAENAKSTEKEAPKKSAEQKAKSAKASLELFARMFSLPLTKA